MEISKTDPKHGVNYNKPISNKKIETGFSEQFNSATKRENDNHLGKLLDSIKKKGRQIIEDPNIGDVREYKKNIKEYLSLVLEDAYRVEKLRSLYDGNPSAFVKIINKELDELTQAVLVEEKGTISVVNKIEHIEGLLVDIYK